MSDKKVFIVGAGFIGWTLLDTLVAAGHTVTALVRRESHAKDIEACGARAILGDLHDATLIADTVAQHDVVFHTATADDLPSAQAVLAGVRRRAERGDETVYIHTSGTSLLADTSAGAFKSDKVYHDNVQAEIDSLPDSAPHRQIDLAILRERAELASTGRAKIALMIPPLIYGTSHGRLTIQLPSLARYALKHGQAAHIGQGKSVWSTVHVRDLARGYMTVLQHLESTPGSASADANPYFFCENTGDAEPSWGEMVGVMGGVFKEAGKVKEAGTKVMPKETYGDVFGPEFTEAVVGSNSRSRAVRLRELGWQPKEKSWNESLVEDELPAIMKEDLSAYQGYAGAVAS